MLNDQNINKIVALEKIATDLNISMANMALAWCLKNPNVSTVITGATKLSQLEQNLQAIEGVSILTEDVMENIEEVLDNKPNLANF